MKDSSLVRAAEAVRDGKAVGHGQRRQHRRHDGQRPAAHGPHQGRRPPGHRHAASRCPAATPTVLLDAGANAECQAGWLVQFAQMGAVFARAALRHRPAPRSACCRSARSRPRATPLVKETHALLADAGAGAPAPTFVGNVEGRDLMTDAVDVVVTDGFTGNVALKTLEGGLQALVDGRSSASSTPPTRPRRPPRCCCPHLLPLYGVLDPDTTGGAMLLGVDGVCIISHGSSSPRRS